MFKNLFESAFENASIGMALVDIDGSFLRINDSFAEIVGYNKKDLLLKTFRDITHPDDLALDNKYLQELFEDKRQNYTMDKRYISYTKDIKYVRLTVSAVKDDDGEIIHYISQIQDTTLQNAVEKELSQFAYAASHDLKEPLRKISVFGEILQKKLEGRLDETEFKYFNYMISGAKKLQLQIEDLLVLSRVSTVSLDVESVNMHQMIKDVLIDLAPMIVTSKSHIKVDNMDFDILSCKPLLESLLLNLVTNAIKYRTYDKQHEIKIWMEKNEGFYTFFIQDNGIGFNMEYIEQVFAPFKRLHSGDAYGGSGIGLATCRRVCERHNWSIDCKSEENKGSTFWFTTGNNDE